MRSWVCCVLALVTFLICLPAAADPLYTVTDLDTLSGGLSRALAINDLGQVVGESDGRPFIWQNGMMKDLSTISGTGTATNINNLGQVVGYFTPPNGSTHASLWQNGVMTDLGTLPNGSMSFAFGINDSGQVVGYSFTQGGFHAALWESGMVTDLGTLGGNFSIATGINNSGQIVGRSSVSGCCGERAFLWQNGVMTNLGILGEASRINNLGQVVGQTEFVSGQSHAFLYSSGTVHDLGTLAGPNSGANDINDLGQIVGAAEASNGVSRAFLYDNVGMRDLNTLIPSGSGWVLSEATGINNVGQIVGSGGHNNRIRAFLLTPTAIPEPTTLVLLVIGLGGWMAVQRWAKGQRDD